MRWRKKAAEAGSPENPSKLEMDVYDRVLALTKRDAIEWEKFGADGYDTPAHDPILFRQFLSIKGTRVWLPSSLKLELEEAILDGITRRRESALRSYIEDADMAMLRDGRAPMQQRRHTEPA